MTAIVFATLVMKVIDFLRLVAKGGAQVSAIVTQIAAWLGGVLLVVLASHANATEAIVLPGTDAALGTLDGASQVLVGLLVASLGSAIVDVKQAIDSSDSAVKPPLVG
jgi:hypothetical protein